MLHDWRKAGDCGRITYRECSNDIIKPTAWASHDPFRAMPGRSFVLESDYKV